LTGNKNGYELVEVVQQITNTVLKFVAKSYNMHPVCTIFDLQRLWSNKVARMTTFKFLRKLKIAPFTVSKYTKKEEKAKGAVFITQRLSGNLLSDV